MIFVGFFNVITFCLKNSRPNKQNPPGWYNSGVKGILARNPSVRDY
jgi:hypothetical protein